MKIVFLAVALTLSGFVVGQLVDARFNPEFGDNPLAQEVPHRDDGVVDMSFIDSLLYKVEQQSPLDQPFILDIESKYNDELNGLYGIDILSYYISQYTGKICIRVHITDDIFYTPEVFVLLAPTGYDGNFDVDLYGIEVSYQRGTLKQDIAHVFKIINAEN